MGLSVPFPKVLSINVFTLSVLFDRLDCQVCLAILREEDKMYILKPHVAYISTHVNIDEYHPEYTSNLLPVPGDPKPCYHACTH